YSDQAALVADGAGGAVIAWTDGRAGNAGHIWAQRLDASGAALWTPNGVPLCTAPIGQANPAIAPDGAHGAIVVWTDFRNGGRDLYARRISASGDTLWGTDGIPVCTGPGDRDAQQIVADAFGGALVAWQDSRGASPDIYAQRLSAAGETRWSTGGVRA